MGPAGVPSMEDSLAASMSALCDSESMTGKGGGYLQNPVRDRVAIEREQVLTGSR